MKKKVVIRGNGNVVGNNNTVKGQEKTENVVTTKGKVVIDGDGNVVGSGNIIEDSKDKKE